MKIIEKEFQKPDKPSDFRTFVMCFDVLHLYRATGVVLGELSIVQGVQFDLFENPEVALKMEEVSRTMDEINAHYGKHKVHLAESLPAQKRHEGERGELPARKKDLLPGENFRQRLGIPLLH